MNYVENMKNIGFSDEIIQKVTEHKDYEAIAKIMDESVSFEDAAARISKEFPSINMEEVKKNLEEMSKQHEEAGNSSSEEVVDIEDDDLEAVAGGASGGLGSWFKSNWKTAGLAFMVGGIAAVALDYVFTKKQATQDVKGAGSTSKKDTNDPTNNSDSTIF
ncbi:hypothetical protein MSI_05620 [Treponema sp. JC4]|uniref:hypothetical protein n=1 Tax=Treponema sp. JC4 TaxID=1124982 RepID=UPI00025B0BD4|nr:hypothetical protein [Treponema sp. JC4]EID85743.1 hypothetical protein MSI_05620 [Treponema sp. JC4]